MQCDEKSLRELLASNHGIAAVHFILDQLAGGGPLDVAMEDGHSVKLQRRPEAESLLVRLGCPARVIRQIRNLRSAENPDLAARTDRLKMNWEKARTDHLHLMQEAFSPAGEHLLASNNKKLRKSLPRLKC